MSKNRDTIMPLVMIIVFLILVIFLSSLSSPENTNNGKSNLKDFVTKDIFVEI